MGLPVFYVEVTKGIKSHIRLRGLLTYKITFPVFRVPFQLEAALLFPAVLAGIVLIPYLDGPGVSFGIFIN